MKLKRALRNLRIPSAVLAADLAITVALVAGGAAGAALNGYEFDQNVSSDDMFQTEPVIAVQPNDPSRVVAATNPIGFTSMPAWISDHYMKPGTVVLRLLSETVVLPQSETGVDGQTVPSNLIADPTLIADREGTFWYGAVTMNSPSQRDCVPGGDPKMCHVVINRLAPGATEFQGTTTAIPAADPTTTAFQDKPLLGIDDWPESPKRGTLYAVWSPLPVSGSGAFSRIVISQCQTRPGGTYDPAHCDDPDNWSQPVDVASSDSNSNPFAGSVTATPDGDVYVTWVDEIANAVEIDRCLAGEDCAAAATWAGGDAIVADLHFPPQDPTKPTGLKKLACPIIAEPDVSPPSPAQFVEAGPDRRVYVVFGDLRDNGTTKCTASPSDDTFDSFIAVLAPNAVAFPNVQATVSLSNDAPASNDHFLATLAVNPFSGEVESHFFSTMGDATRETVNVYYVRSTDGGFSYSAMERISSESSDFRANNAYFDHYMGADSGAAPTASDGTFYGAWIDNREANGPGFREQDLYVLTPNEPPVCDANGPYQAECSGTSTVVTLDGSGSSDPDGDSLGFTWTGPFAGGTATGSMPAVALSGAGAFVVDLDVSDGLVSNACSANLSVVDSIAPSITNLSATPASLWPPNHAFVPVSLSVTATDICDPSTAQTCHVISVTSNELDVGKGSGNTAPDWEITGNLEVELRAERVGTGSGRIYTITVQCSDASGNAATRSTTVSVPHNR